MIYNVLALGRHDPLDKIDDFDMDAVVNRLSDDHDEKSVFMEESHLTDDIFEDTKLIMRNFLSTVCIVHWIMNQFLRLHIKYIKPIFSFQIITKQMSEIYGEAEWKVYVIIKPPWNTVTALKCAIKHWIAAISESFQRRAECFLKELLDAFEHTPGIFIHM